MLNRILSAWAIYNCLPITAKAFGLLPADTVPLDAQGQPYMQGFSTGEPIYTKVKPPMLAGLFGLGAIFFALKNLFKW